MPSLVIVSMANSQLRSHRRLIKPTTVRLPPVVAKIQDLRFPLARSRGGCRTTDRAVDTIRVVVGFEVRELLLQIMLTPKQHVIEALPSDRAD